MAGERHALYLDDVYRDREIMPESKLGKSGRGLRAAQIRVTSFGIEDAIKVLENAGIEGEPIKILETYRDKLEAQAAEIESSNA